MNEYYYRLGAQNFKKDDSFTDNRTMTISDTTSMKKKMSNFLGQMKNYHRNMATNAYWCRDQNFRKYFETRKRNGKEPSIDVNTFYNKDKETQYYDAHSKLNKLIKDELKTFNK